MVPCVTIGDSIAVGVGQARPECEIVARVGITSGRYVSSLLPSGRTVAGTAIISLGVNDGGGADTLENLRLVRGRVDAATVVWLLPGLKPAVREMIRTVAAENGDRTLDTRPEVGRDHLHPTATGYERLAAAALGGETGAVEVAFAPDDGAAAPAPRTRRHARAAHRSAHGKVRHARAARPAGPRTAAGAAARVATAKAACQARSCPRSRAVRT